MAHSRGSETNQSGWFSHLPTGLTEGFQFTQLALFPLHNHKKSPERWERLGILQRVQGLWRKHSFSTISQKSHSHRLWGPREEKLAFHFTAGCATLVHQEEIAQGTERQRRFPKYPASMWLGQKTWEGRWNYWLQSHLSDKRHDFQKKSIRQPALYQGEYVTGSCKEPPCP